MNHLNDKVFDAALREATGGGGGAPDLARTVVRASTAERAEAVAAVADAESGGATPNPFRSVLLAAAAVILGLGVVWAVWSQGQTEGTETPPTSAGDGEVQDPKRAIPKTPKELRDLLTKVDKIRVRGCYARVSVGDEMVEVDLDRGDVGYVEVSAADRATMLSLLNFIADYPTIAIKPNLKPGARVLLDLKDGRHVQLLTELGEVMRVFPDRDIRRVGNEFGNLLAGYMAASFDRAAVELGVVVSGGLNTRMTTLTGDVFRYPSTLQRLELYGAPAAALTQELGRFRDLRELDLTSSAETLDSRELSAERWSGDARSALANVRVLRAPRLGFRVGWLVRQMPKLEVLDASNAPASGAMLLAVLSCPSLELADLRGCTLGSEVVAQLEKAGVASVEVPATATIRMDLLDTWTVDDRLRLQGMVPCKIEWVKPD